MLKLDYCSFPGSPKSTSARVLFVYYIFIEFSVRFVCLPEFRAQIQVGYRVPIFSLRIKKRKLFYVRPPSCRQVQTSLKKKPPLSSEYERFREKKNKNKWHVFRRIGRNTCTQVPTTTIYQLFDVVVVAILRQQLSARVLIFSRAPKIHAKH